MGNLGFQQVVVVLVVVMVIFVLIWLPAGAKSKFARGIE